MKFRNLNWAQPNRMGAEGCARPGCCPLARPVRTMTTIQDRAIQLLEYRLTLGMTTMDGRGFYYPTDTAIAADGRMYVANRSLENVTRGVRVTMCDIDSEYYGTFGAYGVSAGQFIWPSTCTLDSRGRVYVSDEQLHRISVFDREGALLSTWGEHGAGEGQMDTPSGLAFDAELFPEVDGGVLANLAGGFVRGAG